MNIQGENTRARGFTQTRTGRSSGFTLIELLVVVSIIGLLASIILASLDSARVKARDAYRLEQMRTVATALELYYSDHLQYPTMHSTDVPTNWDSLMTTLTAGQYIAKAQEHVDAVYAQSQNPVDRFLTSMLLWPTPAFAATDQIQDPLYSQRSFGYMPASHPTPFQNYRLRAQLEDPSNAALKTSFTGYFLWNDETTGPDACDTTYAYYCTGPSAGFIAFDPGKPVIYLYPEKKTDVTVKIFPVKIENSIPSYAGGWDVTAYPNGTLVNDADQQTYPYLYWEGLSDQPVVDQTKGFVVPTDHVQSFLEAALRAQGLNDKEIQDFTAYWVPRMTSPHPYVYVYFMPQADYNALVPMNISPKPDTLIRVYMVFKELDQKITVTPQTFTAPARTGFTAVEWGGQRSQLQ
ncbi:MAG TPA: type II secretion system protein [Candidatus Paceibacterota bacterium]|nr:type II secretion system protein [Candidatus Paceibacterota bacterium]